MVIYVINPFPRAMALVDICAAFWRLLEDYVSDGEREDRMPMPVLQVIPMSFLTSSESIAAPSEGEYLSLALEVYSRCSAADSKSSLSDGAPPVVLAETLPKGINFQLSADESSPLQEGKCLHIACSRSLDQRWMTMAWSDNTGSLQRTASYCLRFRHSSSARSISDIRGEIWTATRRILETVSARWRVFLVNTDPIDQENVDGKINHD